MLSNKLSWWIGKDNIFYDRHQQLEILFERAFYNDLPKDPELFWQIVGEVWKRTEMPYCQVEAWYTIFSLSPGVNSYTKKWLENPKVVYRGIDANFSNYDFDWSWTNDFEKAQWFSKRFSWHDPKILKFDCAKDIDRVWCVFEDDPENEVLLWSPNACSFVNEG
jgi:hypothetical protein